MIRENRLFNRKLLRTIAKFGLIKILSISSSELEDIIFVYKEYDNNIIINNLANMLVNELVDICNDESKLGECDGIIMNKNTRSIARAFI
jgi:uncharacterized protein (UPF0305 family)